MKAYLFVLPFVVLACSKPDTTLTSSSATGVAAASPSAPEAPSAPKPTASPASDAGTHAPTSVTLRGTLRQKPEWSWMPGAKNPSGKAEAVVELYSADLAMSPPPADGAAIDKALELEDDKPRVTEPASVVGCALKLTLAPKGGLVLDVTEPGCDSMKLLKEPMAKGFVATAHGRLHANGATTPVEIHVELAPH